MPVFIPIVGNVPHPLCYPLPLLDMEWIGGSSPIRQESPPPFSQEEALRLAIENNPRLTAAVRDLRAVRESIPAAEARTNPQITFTPAITGGVGGGSDNELFIAQPLEVNGIRSARRGEASARVRQAQAEAAITLREVVYSVQTAYLELVRARELAALSRDLLRTTEELDRIARKQVELGSRPAIEQIQTGIEVTRARQQVTLSEAGVTVKEAALNTLLNRPTTTPIGQVTLASGENPAAPTLEEAEREAVRQRAEILGRNASAEAFRQQARLVRAEGVPDIAPQFRATSVTRGIQQSGFGVGITLPFLDYGNRRGRIRQAEESARAEEERAAALTAQIRLEVAQALAQVRAAETVLAAYPEGLLAEAKRLLDASRIGYEEGKTTIISLLEAQRTYRQVQSEYINAQVSVAQARVELRRALGANPADALARVERRTLR